MGRAGCYHGRSTGLTELGRSISSMFDSVRKDSFIRIFVVSFHPSCVFCLTVIECCVWPSL
jgi:hypothetical protein